MTNDLIESKVNQQQQVSLVDKVELETQVSTAKFYPRNIKQAIENVLTTATLNKEIAESCIYAKPVDGKIINGPSVRLAEIFLGEWGNIKGGTRVLPATANMVTGEAVIWDLQNNTNYVVQKNRRITTKTGARYGESMIETTGNAAASIAKRDAVFTIVPRAIVYDVYEKIKIYIATGKGSDNNSVAENIKKGIAYFETIGIPAPNLLNALNKAKIDDLGQEDYISMQGLRNGIKEGYITKEELLNDDPIEGTDPALSKGDQLKKKMALKQGAK